MSSTNSNHFAYTVADVESVEGHTIKFKNDEHGYIFLNISDAKNLYEMLESHITEDKSDKDVYGDAAISLERLYDYIDCYNHPEQIPVWKVIADKT